MRRWRTRDCRWQRHNRSSRSARRSRYTRTHGYSWIAPRPVGCERVDDMCARRPAPDAVLIDAPREGPLVEQVNCEVSSCLNEITPVIEGVDRPINHGG